MLNEKWRASTSVARCAAALALVASVLAGTAASPAAAAPRPASEPPVTTVAFLSPEQYAKRWGLPESASPTVSELPADAQVQVVDAIAVAADAPKVLSVPADPPGGKPAQWWIILKEYRDRGGRTVPLRLGNGLLGYDHYAVKHNLRSFAPLEAAFKTSKPDKINGNRVEYIAYVVNTGNGAIHKVVRVITQNASHTADWAYVTPDGKPVGVITAYCQGVDKCPDWVNKVPA